MANYHVNYNTGSDTTGDGSTGSPWATVNHALVTSAATTGDLIKVVGSTTTDLDTTATFATDDRTNQLTTTTDLTSSLAVGDIIVISPNISDGAEFNGWMHTEVEAITSTTLTTRGYHVYPNQTNLSVTITKVNDVVSGGTQESIADIHNYVGAVVEFGYDATFTNVIGRTYFVNTVGVGSRSGTKFSIAGNGSLGGWNTFMPYFKNIAFCRFEYGMNLPFGRMAYANNIVLLNGRGSAGTSAFYVGDAADGTTDVYFNDCNEYFIRDSYFRYGTSGDQAYKNGAPIHLHFNQNRDRQLERSAGIIGNITGYAVRGEVFGFACLWGRSNNAYINGDIVMMGIDYEAYTSNFYRFPTICNGTANVRMKSFKLVKNGMTSNSNFNPVQNTHEFAYPGNSKIVLPTGYDVTTMDMDVFADTPSGAFVANSQQTWIDDNGAWVAANGGIWIKQNLVDQETGNSCLEVFKSKGNGYTGGFLGNNIANFPVASGGNRLQSITVRYKAISGTGSGYFLGVQIGSDIDQIGSMNLGNTTWSNAVITLGFTGGALVDSLPDDETINFLLYANRHVGDHHVLIDSITPTYA